MGRKLFLDRGLVQNLFAIQISIVHDGGSPLEEIVDVRVNISSGGIKLNRAIEVALMESTRLGILQRVRIVGPTMVGSLAHLDSRESCMGETQGAEDLVPDQTFIWHLGNICGSLTCDHVSDIGIMQLCAQFITEVEVLETTENLGSGLGCVEPRGIILREALYIYIYIFWEGGE